MQKISPPPLRTGIPLTVPGFIQLQSRKAPSHPYGTPHYVNTQYPWDGHEKLHPGEIPQAL